MKNFFQILLFLFVFGCYQKKEKKVIISEGKVLKRSEIASLILEMYKANLENKSLILEGKTPNAFS